MAEWISVEDRMPENNDYVLAWSPRYGQVVIAWYYNEDGLWRTEDNFAPFPSHWMPLPEPPENETDYTEVGLEEPEDIDFPCDAPSLVQTICIGKENENE